MYAVTFYKDYAVLVRQCVKENKPIPPREGGLWCPADLLIVAGVMHLVSAGLGPHRFERSETGGVVRSDPQLTNLSDETKEAIRENLMVELSLAIEFLGRMTVMVELGQFDGQFENQVVALMEPGEQHGQKWKFISGLKKLPE